MQVTIYSTTTCPYCKMLKDYLGGHSISYVEKMVDTDDSAREEMMAVSGGFLGVPYTIIVTEDGKKEGIIGFDKGKFNSVLGIQG